MLDKALLLFRIGLLPARATLVAWEPFEPFFWRDFIDLFEKVLWVGRGGQGDAAPSLEPHVGLDPTTLIWPEPKLGRS